ncbi:MAG: DUF3488 and transglutaminase-like domain-containing protein [Actinobacteria bacterium]|nr:DUF3488 and transglutaminase-like domain-containing protein [Actinomycetota bacterium]
MARRTDPTTGHQRLLGLLAVAGLAVAMAFAFGRVFAGRIPTWQLVATALTSVAVAALFERRGLWLATIASLVGLALLIAWIVLPQTTWYGVPTLRTLRALGRSLEFVGQQARVRVAPTAPLPPLLLAGVTAIWTASFSIHALAIRAGSPLLAVLPPIALVGFADTVLQDGARPIYAVTLLAAALGIVFADGIRRVRQWGPVWSSGRRHRLSASVRGSRPVAFLVIASAVLVPGLLPGFRSAPLVDLSTEGDSGAGLDPFISIHAQLDDEVARDLFEVQAAEPAYWRTLALDEFDGETWSSSDPDGRVRGEQLITPVALPQDLNDVPPDAPELTQRFRIVYDIDAPYVPMAHAAQEVATPIGEITYDGFLQQMLFEDGLGEGLEYTVTSKIVNPTPEQLDAVRYLTELQYGRYTLVPESVDPRVEQIARRWTRNEPTPYRKILELQRRFTGGDFFYSTEVEPVADADALLQFLTVSHTGFCQQFATAMATMVRTLGYPARVAVGYRPGTAEEGVFTVQTKDAHAWVEVYFAGYGWLQFEPTPTRGIHPNANPGTYLNPSTPAPSEGSTGGQQPNENSLGGGGAEECLGPGGAPLQGQLCNTESRPSRGTGQLPPGFLEPETASDGSGYSVPYRLILLVLLAAFALLLIAVPIVKWILRRRVLARAGEPRARVLAAYRVFDGEAADLGMGRRDGETLEEHRARLTETVSFSDGHLVRLADATARAAYALDPPTHEEAEHIARDARVAVRDLRRDAGVARRILGIYRPGL